MTQTTGDNYNVKCPHCGLMNHYVSCGISIVSGKVTAFQRLCHHCKKTIYYHGSREIQITAYTEDPTELSKKSSQED